MTISVERLRVWLLVGAGLLLLVIAGFLGYGRWRAHRLLTALPKKLGVNIRRETNGFTYSQSVRGNTVYTIHAAKAVERADGKVTLHDVGIVLYGRQHNRADRIYGKEFEYDQPNGVIRAVGEVHIDLQAPQAASEGSKMDYAAGKDLHGDEHEDLSDPHLIHVKTSGLVFMQKLGVAATDNDIEFASGNMTGHAKGADYNSDSGVVVLHEDVRVNGLQHERPFVLTAAHAELDREQQLVLLTNAKYTVVGAGAQTAEAKSVTVDLRKDGSAERLDARGSVTLTAADRGTVTAPRGEMYLNERSQPRSADLYDGVRYTSETPLREAKGEATQGHADFDSQGHVQHVVMTGAVRLQERIRSTAASTWDQRNLQAAAVDLAMSPATAGKVQLRDAKAAGQAVLSSTSPAKGSGAPVSSSVAGDLLTAKFVQTNGGDHIAEAHGEGHTLLRRVDEKGIVNTSAGDSLLAHFRPATVSQSRDELVDVTQQGHVRSTKITPGTTNAAASQEEKATADKLFYDALNQRTVLTGGVQMSDASGILWADKVNADQKSGDATAEGGVKASYNQAANSQQPVHIMAARASMMRDTDTAIFYGSGDKPARLYQAGSQVTAPVLEFGRKQRRLFAHGEAGGAPAPVHTVLVSTPSSTAKDVRTGANSTHVIRIASKDLAYADETKQADFTGGVLVESPDGTVRSRQATVYLENAQAGTTKATANAVVTNGFMGGSVDRIIATGGIDIQQPGRRATGDRLVYTASDGIFLLTGTPTAPPRVADAEHGTLTGRALRFHAGDQSVVVSNDGDKAGKVRTETQVKNKQ